MDSDEICGSIRLYLYKLRCKSSPEENESIPVSENRLSSVVSSLSALNASYESFERSMSQSPFLKSVPLTSVSLQSSLQSLNLKFEASQNAVEQLSGNAPLTTSPLFRSLAQASNDHDRLAAAVARLSGAVPLKSSANPPLDRVQHVLEFLSTACEAVAERVHLLSGFCPLTTVPVSRSKSTRNPLSNFSKNSSVSHNLLHRNQSVPSFVGLMASGPFSSHTEAFDLEAFPDFITPSSTITEATVSCTTCGSPVTPPSANPCCCVVPELSLPLAVCASPEPTSRRTARRHSLPDGSSISDYDDDNYRIKLRSHEYRLITSTGSSVGDF